MNKYTLRFIDEGKEEEFQQQYNSQTLYPLSVLLFTGGLINSIFKIIQLAMSNKNGWLLIWWIFVFAFVLLQFYINYKYKFHIQKMITLSTLVINIMIIFAFPVSDQYAILITTFNVVTINTFIIFISDFKYSVIQITSILSIWMTYFFINYKVNNLGFPITFFNVMIVSMVVSYFNQSKFRQKYLLLQQQNLWVHLIQYVCSNPFQILTFDNINLKYKIENQNNFENQDFLKQTLFENQPLQNYIYQTQTNLVPITGLLKDETIIVNQKKQHYKIRITYYYIQKIFIIVQILQDDNKIEFLRKNNQKIDKKLQEMICQIVKILPSAVKSKKNLLKLKLGLTEIYFRRFKVEIKSFNLNKLISRHIKPFNKYREQIQFEYERIITLNGYQNLYSLIFMRIFYSQSKINLIRLMEQDYGYQIVLYGEIKLDYDHIIQSCLQVMKLDIEIQKNCIIISKYLVINIKQTDVEFNDHLDFICENQSYLMNS